MSRSLQLVNVLLRDLKPVQFPAISVGSQRNMSGIKEDVQEPSNVATQHVKELIDIGANLTDDRYYGVYYGKQKHDQDLEYVIRRAIKAGVGKIIVTAGTLEESRKALNMAKQYDNLYSTVGVHPTRAGEFEKDGTDGEKYFQELMSLAIEGKKLGKVVAIGECGLDYDRTQFCSKEVQLKHFEKHFRIAKETKLPMFLHNRNTGDDFVQYIQEQKKKSFSE